MQRLIQNLFLGQTENKDPPEIKNYQEAGCVWLQESPNGSCPLNLCGIHRSSHEHAGKDFSATSISLIDGIILGALLQTIRSSGVISGHLQGYSRLIQ